MSKEQKFIEKAIFKHNNFYNYSLVSYQSAKDNVEIVCPIHGVFEQTPNNHLTGHGCNKCSKDKNRLHTKTLEKFVQDANLIHNNEYDYSLVSYKNAHTKIKIQCREHGIFNQNPTNHLNGQGCPKCNISKSKGEKNWLDSLGIEEKFRQKSIKIDNKLYKVDAFRDNTIYEYLGDYWHGNPKRFDPLGFNKQAKKTYKELYENTLQRINLFKTTGYRVIFVWEYDFKEGK